MIKIICTGKIKESFIKSGIEEYQKRISKYTKLEILELPDIANDNINIILEKEKKQILSKLKDKDYVITLEIEGQELTSIEFSNTINNLLISNSNIVFIIGSSYGIHEEIKRRSNFHLSFSKLTFPHQIFRILLLEQIYRSYKILNNETYHK